jgi:hypothetical protein
MMFATIVAVVSLIDVAIVMQKSTFTVVVSILDALVLIAAQANMYRVIKRNDQKSEGL